MSTHLLKASQRTAWLALVWLLPAVISQAASSLLTVDYKKLVSRADLIYDTPAPRSEEGMPVGNGRMGSLVWTSPSAGLAARPRLSHDQRLGRVLSPFPEFQKG
jgi:hypothetical protein